jgi:hypothetical protein
MGARGFLTVGMSGVLTLGVLSFVAGAPLHAKLVNLLSGHGWLSNDPKGEVMLANGETGRLDFRLDVGGTAGGGLDIVKSGNSTVLVDQKTGDAGSIDLSNLNIVDQHRVSPGGDLGTVAQQDTTSQMLPAPAGDFYLVNRRSGEVQAIDPLQKVPVATKHLSPGLSPAIVDGGGTLWVENHSSGALVSVALKGRQLQSTSEQTTAVAPGDDVLLSSVNGSPAVLDQTRGVFFTAPDGQPGPAVSLPRGQAGNAVIASALTGSVVPIGVPGGVLLVGDGTVVERQLPGAAHDRVGAPVAYQGRIYVPLENSATVVVLSSSGLQIGQPIVLDRANPSPLVLSVQNGVLFIDESGGSSAVAVNLDGSVMPIDKADPNVPTHQQGQKPLPAPALSPLVPLTVPAPTPTRTTPSTVPSTAPAPTPSVPPSVPDAPGNATALAGNASATISWTAPNDHGSPITAYTISWTGSGGGTQTQSSTANQTSAIVKNLQNGNGYTFSVTATNGVGQGPGSQTNSVTPTSSIPGMATSVVARAQTNGSIIVSWNKANGQGMNIANYTVNGQSSSGTALAPVQVTGGFASTLGAAEGIVLGDSYTFTVTATNVAGGSSPPSAPTPAVTAHTAPTPVASLTASPGDGKVTLSWVCDPSAVSCSNGSPVTSFNVSVSPAGAAISPVPAVATTSSYSDPVGGLTNGTGYTFTVQACNAVGCTSASTAPTVPFGAPGQPSVSGSVNGTTISWSWNVPSGNGAAVTSFNISVNGSLVAQGLQTSYSSAYGYSATETLSVVAVNAGGAQSPPGTNAQTTGPPPPPPPTISISQGGQVPSTSTACMGSPNCYWIDVSFSGFPAGGSWPLLCYDGSGNFFNSSNYGFQYTANGSGSGSYAPSGASGPGCADSVGASVHVTINGVTSNTITI